MLKKSAFLFTVTLSSLFTFNYWVEQHHLDTKIIINNNLNASPLDTSTIIQYKPNVKNARGKALSIQCNPCHGANFEKKALGKSNIVKGMPEDKVETVLKSYKAGTLNTHGSGKLMKGQLDTLSDADIKDIAAYVAGLK